MDRGERIALSALEIEVVGLSTVLFYRPIGWVPFGVLMFLMLYLAIRKLGVEREELGLGGGLDLKIHVLLPLAFMLLNFVWLFPWGWA